MSGSTSGALVSRKSDIAFSYAAASRRATFSAPITLPIRPIAATVGALASIAAPAVRAAAASIASIRAIVSSSVSDAAIGEDLAGELLGARARLLERR